MPVANRGQLRSFPQSLPFETRVSMPIPPGIPCGQVEVTDLGNGDRYVRRPWFGPFVPQCPGDEHLIMPIPMLHTLNDSYNLL